MLTVRPITAFDDNYIWLISADSTGDAFVVDPGDPAPVLARLEEEGLNLTGILITHHHFDHVGGIGALREAFAPTVYGPDNPAIDELDVVVRAGDRVDVLGTYFDVLEVPGHTLDHIAYHSADNAQLFCGDTLFAGGCGRVFEGTPGMMHASLQQLATLPADTQVFCAHEYTLANLDFASAVEPDNQALAERITTAKSTRAAGLPTVPSTLALETATNPFMRCEAPELVDAMRRHGKLSGTTGAEVFAAVRGWKDNF
ncbi:hydroxyacylglutathione hydrolase [Halioglobus japonicus]|uniref:Hydroxyacylglutathione hydrolase n=1 Tax=Halioglobus japonicus TaxID=930805 RepID=A0AAP8MHQ6_9GAMM|nr:hydroxyacylglutathione hydrolase [Halioglobus japonicus]AQA18926.1 hydroxyacylglutathione hydrolase [Halioglobus japonicus]PLW88060.1 hydroxyacylglutathione hydrolase [Halioglobus japonicus]GHD20634.1 hydroxyacylglutathione hydrolase [Halioglobus japonicus]